MPDEHGQPPKLDPRRSALTTGLFYVCLALLIAASWFGLKFGDWTVPWVLSLTAASGLFIWL